MREIYDITRTLGRETPPYPGDAPFFLRQAATVSREGFNLSEIALSAHSGTHIDAPRHFFRKGKTLDQYPARRFVLNATVAVCGVRDVIRRDDLAGVRPRRGEALILKTRNSRLPFKRFNRRYVYLDEDAAQWIAQRGVSLVGFDYYSVDAFDDKGQKAHHILLAADVLVLENLDLRRVKAGRYGLVCLPLRIAGAEAAPCRAVLMGR